MRQRKRSFDISEPAPSLRSLSLLREQVTDWSSYPFDVPVIRNLGQLDFTSRVVFFVGENGSGKSTLLEAVAEHCGYNREGGSENIRYQSSADKGNLAVRLTDCLRLSWSKRLRTGYFLRAESFFNVATYLDELQAEDKRTLQSYGGESLHEKSHGESFLALVQNRLTRDGFYLLDEPEAALSPQRQLAFLLALRDTLAHTADAQFIIATHSPIILAYPAAQIFSFDGDRITEIAYRDTAAYQVTSGFLANPEAYLYHLFRQEG